MSITTRNPSVNISSEVYLCQHMRYHNSQSTAKAHWYIYVAIVVVAVVAVVVAVAVVVTAVDASKTQLLAESTKHKLTQLDLAEISTHTAKSLLQPLPPQPL